MQASLNYKEINLLLLDTYLAGARIQDVAQPRPDHLILQLFHHGKRSSLLFVMDQRACRFHFTSQSFANPSRPQRFVSFLRAHAVGSTIRSVDHVRDERILKFSLERGGLITFLWVRLWSSAPNIIFTSADCVIGDALFRRPKKGEVSGGRFDPEEEFTKNPPRPKDDSRFTIRELDGAGSLHEQFERAFSATGPDETDAGRRERILTQLAVREQRLLSSLDKIESALAQLADHERFRQYGDILMSGLHEIRKGDAWYTARDFFHDGEKVEIALDRTLSPVGNAEKYYTMSKKTARTRLRLFMDKADTQEKLRSLRETILSVLRLTDEKTLCELEKKYFSDKTDKVKNEIPGLSFRSGEFAIFVGRTALENESLFRRHVRGNDVWLHCRDYPGASVFIKSRRGKSVPLEVMLDAANLAVFYSKGKHASTCDLYYTPVKYLRKAKTDKKGLFLPTQEKNLTVRPDPKRIERLKNLS